MSDTNDLDALVQADLQAVLLDAGNTLLRPEPAVEQRYADTARTHGVEIPPAAIRDRFVTIWRRAHGRRARQLMHADDAGTRAFWREIVAEVFAPWSESFTDFERFFAQLYDDFSTARAWRVYDDVWPCLRALRRAGLGLAVVSNWDRRLVELLEATGLAGAFDTIVVSAEVGVEKPARGIFSRALDALQVEPGQVLHVGDSWADDVEGARGAGLWAGWLCRDPSLVTGSRSRAGAADARTVELPSLWPLTERLGR